MIEYCFIFNCLTHPNLPCHLIGTWNGADREQFESVFRNRVSGIMPRLPDEEREEDLVQAALFMYTPWPLVHNESANREAVGRVCTV